MEHIKVPLRVEQGEAVADLLDADGKVVFWLNGQRPEFEEIAKAVNAYDDLIATVASAEAMAASVERLMTVATRAFDVIEQAMLLVGVFAECPFCGERAAHTEQCVYLDMRDVLRQAHGEDQ